jgi:hypothetical protein
MAVNANGRVNWYTALLWRIPQRRTPSASAIVSAFARPAMASMSVNDIGIEAVMPVVVATPLSTTTRRSRTYWMLGCCSSRSSR